MSSLVELKNLVKHFPVKSNVFFRGKQQVVHAVQNVSFEINKGETLGLVGESGCGKTTIGRLMVRLLQPTNGNILFDGEDIFSLKDHRSKGLTRKIQMIFQETRESLNPRKDIRQILSKPMLTHSLITPEEVDERVCELLDSVNLCPPERFLGRFPHELSGGQANRVATARAISLNPELIVADEPVSSLDVSVRSQILQLMGDLQKKLDLTLLFISHDLAVVRFLSKRVAVMYLGRIVAVADVDELFENPIHPYTRALISATPIPNPKKSRERDVIVLKGEVPSPIDPPPGCAFHPRCSYAIPVCSEKVPHLDKINGRSVACHVFPKR
ncbi:MAG: ABC transporter ATP-binding protein [Candidatus Thorarchaeota archaeon]|jgi:oligopeptide/dipeptide ABC transporter ATP-binding protein